jgi:hypothetical protein
MPRRQVPFEEIASIGFVVSQAPSWRRQYHDRLWYVVKGVYHSVRVVAEARLQEIVNPALVVVLVRGQFFRVPKDKDCVAVTTTFPVSLGKVWKEIGLANVRVPFLVLRM